MYKMYVIAVRETLMHGTVLDTHKSRTKWKARFENLTLPSLVQENYTKKGLEKKSNLTELSTAVGGFNEGQN